MIIKEKDTNEKENTQQVIVHEPQIIKKKRQRRKKQENNQKENEINNKINENQEIETLNINNKDIDIKIEPEILENNIKGKLDEILNFDIKQEINPLPQPKKKRKNSEK